MPAPPVPASACVMESSGAHPPAMEHGNPRLLHPDRVLMELDCKHFSPGTYPSNKGLATNQCSAPNISTTRNSYSTIRRWDNEAVPWNFSGLMRLISDTGQSLLFMLNLTVLQRHYCKLTHECISTEISYVVTGRGYW